MQIFFVRCWLRASKSSSEQEKTLMQTCICKAEERRLSKDDLTHLVFSLALTDAAKNSKNLLFRPATAVTCAKVHFACTKPKPGGACILACSGRVRGSGRSLLEISYQSALNKL